MLGIGQKRRGDSHGGASVDLGEYIGEGGVAVLVLHQVEREGDDMSLKEYPRCVGVDGGALEECQEHCAAFEAFGIETVERREVDDYITAQGFGPGDYLYSRGEIPLVGIVDCLGRSLLHLYGETSFGKLSCTLGGEGKTTFGRIGTAWEAYGDVTSAGACLAGLLERGGGGHDIKYEAYSFFE